jgi:hypothetical protein
MAMKIQGTRLRESAWKSDIVRIVERNWYKKKGTPDKECALLLCTYYGVQLFDDTGGNLLRGNHYVQMEVFSIDIRVVKLADNPDRYHIDKDLVSIMPDNKLC